MDISTLLADPNAIGLEGFISNTDSITMVVRSSQKSVGCPLCSELSSGLHSNYIRRVADLPWHGVKVKLELHTRRFRCRNELCPRKVFCERLPKVAAAYARKTVRLNSALELLAFALGGEAGARTASGLGLTVSGDTLLRRIRVGFLKTADIFDVPRVLGVDDFAFRRGQRYGTILVDLEKRQAIDLLPDREADTLCQWLKAHPGVEVISRDRSPVYADGARRGAPDATQVADRFHLLQNLRTAFENLLCRQTSVLKHSYQTVMEEELSALKQRIADQAEPASAGKVSVEPKDKSSILERRSLEKRRRKQEQFLKVKKLRKNGFSILQIAKSMRMHRRTVRLYLQSDTLPERRKPTRFAELRKYLPFLEQRWAEGKRNATQLGRELKEKGYSGKVSTVGHYLVGWREICPDLKETAEMVKAKLRRFAVPSPKKTYWLLFKPRPSDEKWSDRYINQLLTDSPEIREAVELVREFFHLMKNRQADELQNWLARAEKSKISELISFVNGIKLDLKAVEAAFSSEWSNGQTEGQVNRLKFIKRQMYGRAKFDLLKARVVHQN